LSALSAVSHGFIGRVDGIDVDAERDVALRRLAASHAEILQARGLTPPNFATAEQIHGNKVAHAEAPRRYDGTDALVTATPGLTLGIYVADCAAVYLVDQKSRSIGLAHSGKKGTELEIARATLEKMADLFGTIPANVLAIISPCIRPPHYEIDFAATIRDQLKSAGVSDVVDDQTCTASEPLRFYSYRRELGRTGRMLAFLRLNP
jgi:copper oxidase (laccase) domain-containing protein